MKNKNPRRRAGAFDRFLSFQVDSEGNRVLNRTPISVHDEIEYIREQNERANRARVIRMERELVRQKLREQQVLAKAALDAEYRRMIHEARDQGFLIEEECTPSSPSASSASSAGHFR